MPRWTGAGFRLAAVTAGVAATTAACTAISGVNASTAGFVFLLLVLAAAAAWGLAEAIVASVEAMLCFNYFFLPPVGRFTIEDPENWVALFAFLVTALVASHLSDRARQQATEARQRQLETERLYALSRAILLTETTQSIGSRMAESIAQVFGAASVVLYDASSGQTFQGGPVELAGAAERLKQTVVHGAPSSEDGVDVWPISLGGRPIGALAARGLEASDGAAQALLNLVAIAIERVRTESATRRAEAARQSEEFKSTLLDAVAHEFKTPLTSIKAAATALLAHGEITPGGGELLTVIDEETDRLNALVTEAVRVSQIDAGKVRLARTACPVEALLEEAVAGFGSRAEGRVERGAAMAESIHVDREMVVLALRQVIDNALKYSPPSAPVRVWGEQRDGLAVIHVADGGAGVPEADRERIFEKFHRAAKVRERVPGSGLGLHIAREIARAHGGDLWVEGAVSGGADFCLALPRAEVAA